MIPNFHIYIYCILSLVESLRCTIILVSHTITCTRNDRPAPGSRLEQKRVRVSTNSVSLCAQLQLTRVAASSMCHHRLAWLLVSCTVASGRAKVTLRYFPVAARGELARLYAVAGGLEIVDSVDTNGYQNDTLFGFLPALDHPEAGVSGLQESLAIERYVAAIAPMFSGLTPAQRAIDDMFACAKEDLMVVESCLQDASIARACVPLRMERYFSRLELLVPEQGFVHGLAFPTGADLVTLIIAKAGFPWGRAMLLAGYTDWPSRFPKVHALAERTASVPDIAHYLDRSTTFYAKLQPDLPPSVLTTMVTPSSTVVTHVGSDKVLATDDAPTFVSEAAVNCALLAVSVATLIALRRASAHLYCWSRSSKLSIPSDSRPYAAYT